MIEECHGPSTEDYIVPMYTKKTIHGILILNSKKELVEKGLKQFHQSEEFRGLLEWILNEHEKQIKSKLKENIESRIHENKDFGNWFEAQEDDWFLSLLQEEK
jgi:hypothetical protein